MDYESIKLKKNLLSLLFSLCLCAASFPQTVTSEGTDFWIAFPPNDVSPILTIFISSNYTTSGNITSAYPGVNQSFNVVPGIVTQIVLPSGVVLLSGTENKGIHITSNDPVCVYGLNHFGATTDAYLALPVNALGLDYRIMSYKVSIPPNGSDLSVVATQDGTNLSIFNHQTSNTSNVTLNQGQTYLLEESAVGADLTGSWVQSNYPVGVFGSVNGVSIPASSCPSADHIVEMMFPVNSWGKNFVTVPLAGRADCGDIFRVLAAQDGTQVSVNGTTVATLNTGDYYQSSMTGYNSINASKATLVAQYAKGSSCCGNLTGDPLMMLIIPQDQFLTQYTVINTAGGFLTHWINVVAPDYAVGNIYQDGVLIPSSAFVQIGTTNFYGAQRSVTAGSHTFNSTAPFGVSVYGWGNADSYGYPGGGSLAPIGTVNNVTLSPDTAYGQLNVTNVCLTANVMDNLLNPVVGVLVNFYVSGLNPLTGNAYTDAMGNAQYCYTQTGVIAGEDHVYAEVFGFKSDTSVVFWSYNPPCSNPVSGGIIGNDQSGCGSYIPSTLNNISLPTGFTGNLEYKWQLSTTSSTTGFNDIGNNNASYSSGLITQTTWFKRIARVDCMTDWNGAVESNVIEMTVIDPLPVNVSIATSANNVCSGTSVTFTATPTHGGITPGYQWKVNGVNVGGNSQIYSYIPINNDVITCTLTSSEVCTTGNPAISNQVTMTVNPNQPVNISITSSGSSVCAGTMVTFNALPINQGTTPLYQWKVNGINVGTNSTNYSYVPLNGDQVSCVLNSNATCATGNPTTSNVITMTVSPNLTVTVNISASANPVCSGIAVTYTATPNNAGGSPVYQWKVNGVNAGTNATTYTYNPIAGDQVLCILNSSIACPIGNPATSNTITMNVGALPVVTFTTCFDTITTLNAKPIKLKGGIPLGGTYSGPGVIAGYFYPNLAGIGTKSITYSYSNSALCSAAATVTIINYPLSIINCGLPLTDIRDGKIYPTIQIGSQCWMAANLNYGTRVPSTEHQRDNCINEKYCYNDLTANCEKRGANYQWDEIMRYDETPGLQGLCPPAWHVPTEAEWNTLFANYTNNGFAGSPLKYSGFSGFNALLSGVNHFNRQWDFQNFATFFWSSTPYGAYKAWAHGLNDFNPSVSFYPSSRVNAFSVRCLKDN